MWCCLTFVCVYISTILTCKANRLCEYYTLFNMFRKLIRKFECSNAKYVNIRKIHAFLFHNGFYSINKQKCKFFYEHLLRKNSKSLFTRVYCLKKFTLKTEHFGKTLIAQRGKKSLTRTKQNSTISYLIIFWIIIILLVNGIKTCKNIVLYVLHMRKLKTFDI